MARNWTIPQQQAINTRNKTLLVSAAAGSGKTATLTERIIRRITDKNDPADISKMLIVTFTRTAAAELRTRLFSALGEALAADPSDKHLATQLMKISSAKICTIDSFFLELVKSNFSSLSVPATFRTVDDSEYLPLAREAMDASIEEIYETDPSFPAFSECFTSARSANKLTDTMLNFHKKLLNIPEGIAYVARCSRDASECAKADFFASCHGKVLRDDTAEFFEYYRDIFAAALLHIQDYEDINKSYGPSFAYDHQFCKELCDTLRDDTCSYSQAQALISSYSPISLKKLSQEKKTEDTIAYQNRRKTFSEEIKKLSSKTYSKTPQVIERAMNDTALYLDVLYRLLALYEAKLEDTKAKLSIMTFSDVRRQTLRLLADENGEPTQIAKEYAEQFSEIYIDEYQDVDRVQDLIFRSISKPTNRFMVGDIKQSIYGFRGSEPLLFSEYRKKFPPLDDSEDSECATIFMSDNFRCDENIINFSNTVCSPLFSVCPDTVAYTPADDLKFSKTTSDGYVSPKVKIAIISPPPEEAIPSDEKLDKNADARRDWEARYIAKEIERLFKEEKNPDGKPIKPEDIAILFRSSKIIPLLTAALDERNILYSLSDSASYFENSDVLLMIALLNTIDNPERDVHLAGTLRSPLFDFTLDDLITVRNASSPVYSLYGALCEYAKLEGELADKCREFISELEGWQADAAALSVDRFLRLLFESDRFISSGIVSQTDARGQGGNLLLLYEYARSFEGGSFKGLYQFVEYLNSIISRGGKLSNDAKGKVEGRVSLMTIHKSKGLEFPVCFLCSTTASIGALDTHNSLVYDYPTGIALKIADGHGLARINTPLRDAINVKIANKSIEEDMRLLYVALTRARERLYLTATTSKSPDSFMEKSSENARFFNRYTVMKKCSSYFDWVLLSLKENDSSCEFLSITSDQLADGDAAAEGDASESFANGEDAIDKALIEKLSSEFAYEYPYRALSHVPSKLSVSKLYPDILDENESSLCLFSSDDATPVPEFFSGIKQENQSASRGTATHLFFQFCDFARLRRTGAEEELERLIELKFLPADTRNAIYLDEIEKFTKSELFSKILGAKQIIREQRFNVELPASQFTSSADLTDTLADETLAVQGVIDLLLIDENGNIALFDYKTDRLSRAEREDFSLARQKLNDRHALQLTYYKNAIELLFGKPCGELCVYSTHSSLLYPIDPAF